MKKLLTTVAAAIFSLSICGTMASCSSDDPKPQEKPEVPTPEPDPKPDPTPSTGVDTDVKNYFIGVLKGEDVELPNTDEISVDNVEEATKRVWNLWTAAYGESGESPLPTPANMHNDYNNGGDYGFAGSWSLSNGETMSYYLGYKGTRPESGWPLFISLHGSGESSSDEWYVTIDWDDYYLDDPSLYLVPMSPKGGSGCRWYQPSRQQAWEKVFRMAYTSGTVDPNKIYIKGISEGAYGSQRLAGFYADYLAGVGPISGGEPLYNFAAENTANIFYCARTGEYDTMYGRLICTKKAKELWEKLAQEHPGYYEHYIDIMPGAGHDLYDGTNFGYDGITVKLKEHTRNPYPKYVYWENYALGNINGESYECRKAFYNIRPLEAQNGKTDGNVHDAYEMSIDGNVITLNVSSVTVTPTENVSEEGWSMAVNCEKTSEPATKGKIRLYLNNELVDLSSPVTVIVNGKTAFEGEVKPSSSVMVESAALFFDPARVFPAAVDVEVK